MQDDQTDDRDAAFRHDSGSRVDRCPGSTRSATGKATSRAASRVRLGLTAVAATLVLGGCATVGNEPRSEARSDVQQAVADRDCRGAYELLEGGGASFADGIAAAQVCLQSGDFVRAERLAAQAESIAEHPDVDYAGYVGALARFGRWRSARGAGIEQRIELGRAVYNHMLGYSREYPLSSYNEEVAPRMVQLREDIARLELRRAEQARDSGRNEEAADRARYVRDHYEGSDAAREAAALLHELQAES